MLDKFGKVTVNRRIIVMNIRMFLLLLCFTFFPMRLFSYEDPFLSPWDREQIEQENRQQASEQKVKQGLEAKRPPEEKISVSRDKKALPIIKEEPAKKPEWAINGLIWDNEGNAVIISGSIFYRVGDFIEDNCKISGIANRQVLVRCGEHIWKYDINDRGEI